MSDIDDFIREKNPQPKQKRSKLDAFHDEIFQLKEMGFSEKVIVEFLLEKKNVKVAQQTLNQFIRSRSRSGSLKSANAVEVPPPQPQVAPIENPPTEVPTEQANSTPADKPKSKKGIKKFDWKNATTDGLI